MVFPQFAKTKHPQVIDSIRETLRRADEFSDRVHDMAEQLTGDRDAGYVNGWLFSGKSMIGIAAKYADKLPGQWKKPRNGIVRPYKNNPVSEDIHAIHYKAAKIPGRDNLVHSPPSLDTGWFGTGTLFEYDGYVYSGFTYQPEDRDMGHENYGWLEIMPSEFHAAMEAENERRRKDQTDG